MADATTDAFLQGQGIPVDPNRIETELTRLWGPAAQQVGGPDLENPTVTRVVLANLVVGTQWSDAGRIEGVLDTVVTRYPSRAIVLRHDDEPGRHVSAEISALCHLPAPGMPQVCSERIVLRAGTQGLDLLPAAVRSLLEADLPFVLWWTYDPREAQDLFLDLADECSRLILDLPDPAAEPAALRLGLDLARLPYSRDIAWFGISRWRELVAQFFDGPCRDNLSRITSVQVQVRAPTADRVPRAAAWLVGWLAGQLDWTPQTRRAPSPDRLEATFDAASGPVEVSIATEADARLPFAQLSGVTLTASTPDGEASYRLARPSCDAAGVRIEVDSARSCSLPRVVHAPTFDAARRVAAALESSREDPPFCRALPSVLWLLSE